MLGQLARLEPSRPVADKDTILTTAHEQRLGCIGLDAHDLVTQAEAGSTDPRDARAHFEDIVHARRRELLCLGADHRETEHLEARREHRFAWNAHLARQHMRRVVHPGVEARIENDARWIAVAPADLYAYRKRVGGGHAS